MGGGGGQFSDAVDTGVTPPTPFQGEGLAEVKFPGKAQEVGTEGAPSGEPPLTVGQTTLNHWED